MAYYETDCIILRNYQTGERDRFISVLTSEFGKLNIKVRGINKTLNKYGSSLEPFAEEKITFYKKTENALPILTNTKVINSRYNLRKDIKRFTSGSHILEIVNNFHFGEDKRLLFSFLRDVFSYLEQETDCNYLIIWFFFKFLAIIGYSPCLDLCTVCNSKIERSHEVFVISPHTGGMVCKNCDDVKTGEKTVISEEIYSLLKSILDGLEYSRFKQYIENCNKKTIYNVEKLTQNFILYYTEKKLKTEKMVCSMGIWGQY